MYYHGQNKDIYSIYWLSDQIEKFSNREIFIKIKVGYLYSPTGNFHITSVDNNSTEKNLLSVCDFLTENPKIFILQSIGILNICDYRWVYFIMLHIMSDQIFYGCIECFDLNQIYSKWNPSLFTCINLHTFNSVFN